MKHEKTAMGMDGQFATNHTYRTGRRGNIWRYIFVCPVCGEKKKPLVNTSRGRAYYCNGNAAARKTLRLSGNYITIPMHRYEEPTEDPTMG